MNLYLTEEAQSPPAAPLLTLDEAKRTLRVDHDDEDAEIADMVAEATDRCEQYARRAFVARPFLLTLDRFPRAGSPDAWQVQDGDVWPPRFGNLSVASPFPQMIPLPFGELRSLTSIRYAQEELDDAGALVWVTADPETYRVAAGWPARLVPLPGQCWPATAATPAAVEVRYVAGYGLPSAVPASIRRAVKLTLGTFYEHREDQITGTSATELPMAAERLLAPYRMFRA